MKQRRINATLTVAALALTTLLILPTLPRANTAAPTVASLSTNPKRINESAEAHSFIRSPFVDSTPGATTRISAAPRLGRQSLESLTTLNSTEATERDASLSVVSVPSVASGIPVAYAKNVEVVGHIGGYSDAIAIEGHYAYVSFGPELAVLDISDPTHPTRIGYVVLPGFVCDVAVAGDYAYVADYDFGLRVISVADPTQPTEVGSVDTPGTARDVTVVGDYAYVADGSSGLRVISVADPTQPTEVGYYDTPGKSYGVAVAGSYAYVVDRYPGLRVISVADPTQPTEVGYYNTPGMAYDVAVVGDYVYVADGTSGLQVISVADPTQPTEVGSLATLGFSYDVAVSGSYAYLADGAAGLRVISVADPTQPTEMGLVDTPAAGFKVAVSGSYAYVADGTFGLRVISVADPTQPTEMGSLATAWNSHSVAVAGGYAYVGDSSPGLRVISVADPAQPTEVGYYDLPGLEIGFEVAVVGDYAYVADWNYGLRVISVADPTQPTEVGSLATPGAAWAVAMAGSYAYVADRGLGLRVISVADPTQPIEVGYYDTPGSAYDVAVAEGYAYVADIDGGLRVISVANPNQPTEVGYYDAPEVASGVAVAGSYAYVADGTSGLRVISVADPTQPTEVGLVDTPNTARSVAVAGDYAYVADYFSGLRVISVADPTHPTEVGYYDTPSHAEFVTAAGGYIYITDGASGLFILRFTGGPGPTYSISGQVTDAGGNPISDVTISDGAGHTVATNSNGNYTISELSAGTYTLTPSKSDYTFAPASRTVSVPPSATGQDFTEAPAPPPPLDKPPVILVHGHRIGPGITRCSAGVWRWEIDSNLPETFGEMARWLKKDGFDVWVAHYETGLLGTPSLEKNAECLKDQIAYVRLQVTGAQQVILIAHSMGGLVSRAYIEGPDYQYRNDVQALITLGSPHVGIPYEWFKFLFRATLPLVCRLHEGLCKLEEKEMEVWNQEHGPKSQEVAPPYYLIGGDKSDSFLGRKLRRWADPNDGMIGTRSAQAGTDANPAIQSYVKGRYQTTETHSSSWVLGSPTYFQPPTGQVHSQSYQCIQNVLLGTSNPCAEPSVAVMLAQAVPTLTEYTSDVRGHITSSQTVTHSLQVDADGTSLFYLSWVTGTLGITLTNPVGTVIDPTYAAANTDVVTYTTSPGSEMTPPFAAYAFTTTVPGLYTATIAADDVGITGTDYLLFAAMETTRTLSVALDSDRYQIGDTAVLTATLEGAGAGITGATVQATFSRSDAITDTLTLTDQGDGTYRGTYAIPNAPGYLHLRVTAEGSDAGTQFSRQVDRLLTVASQAVQLTGTYADRADDADGNGRYETLTVEVEVLAAGAGDFTFSADLVAGGDQFVAHVITQTALITGTQNVSLRFDGELIHDGESDGPFTVTNLFISDLQNAGIPSVMADDVWTTAAYDHTQFGRITGDMNGDCIVNIVDIMLVACRWNTTIGDIGYDGLYDLDNSGNIDIADIMFVAAHWREKCE